MVANRLFDDVILTRSNSGISRMIQNKKPRWDIAEISENILASAL